MFKKINATNFNNHNSIQNEPLVSQNGIDFFHDLWGNNIPDGYLVLWTKQDKQSYSFHTNKLADAVLKADQLKDKMDVYFSLGIQREAINDPYKRGFEDGVIALPGLWFDFDISGPGHVKNDLPANANTLVDFIHNELPIPTLSVASGGGLHVYWRFNQPLFITTEEQLKAAKDLSNSWHQSIIEKGMAVPRGWDLDNTDAINQLLRIPGTINHKYGKEVVVCQSSKIQYGQEELSKYVHKNQSSAMDVEGTKSSTENSEVSNQSKPITTVNTLNELVDHCSFLTNCRDHSLILSEPEWHKMVCILATQEGGPELIHELSKPYPRYKKEETDKKIQNAISKNPGPIKCATLKTLYNCKKDCGVTSPIYLLKKQSKVNRTPIMQTSQPNPPIQSEDVELPTERIEWDILKDRVPDYPFPWDALPLKLSEALKDLAKDMSVNPAMVGVIGLSVLSSAIGSAVRHLESKKGYGAPLNLWISIIAETGDKKTPVLNRLMKPIYKIQKQLIAQFKQQQAQQQQANTQQTKQNSKQPKFAPSLFTTDPTIEALIDLLCKNLKGIMLFQDELSSFLLSFNKYRGGKGGDREQYLNLWSGTPIKVDRVDKQLYASDPFFSLLGGLQPRKAIMVFGEKSFDDGLISRFLFFNNKHKANLLTDHQWSSENEKLWNELVIYLYGFGVDDHVLLLTKEAWEVFRDAANSLKALSQYVPYRFRVFIPKAENYILRITGILHVVESVLSGAEEINKNVSADTVRKAIKIVYFFLGQARQVVELYGPTIKKLDRNYVVVIDAVLETISKQNLNSVPVADIMVVFNNIVPAEAAIISTQKFGALVKKVLTDLRIAYDKKRQNNTKGKLVQHIVIPNDSKKKLLQIQQEQK